VLAFLAAIGFSNYIVSGGGRDFMRPISQEVYGIPRQRVIASSRDARIPATSAARPTCRRRRPGLRRRSARRGARAALRRVWCWRP
jgi:hypothetical protein